MLSPADVIREPDFILGSLQVSPSSRQIVKDGRSVTVEPRVMQVLVLLARHLNEVVTRDTLFAEIWGGVMVGDDSLNRAISGARKVVALDPGGIALETIPRTGYRLVAAGAAPRDTVPPPALHSRRTAMIGAVAATAAACVGAGLWLRNRDRDFDALVKRGKEGLLYGDPGDSPVPVLERAVALRPDDAHALGLLAYARAMRIKLRLSSTTGSLPAAADAANAALAVDPEEPNARLANLFVRQATTDLLDTENQILAVRKAAPDNVFALANHWELLTCVGRTREALGLTKRALSLEPMSARVHYPLAQLLWINGQSAEADRVIDQASRNWPDHRFIRFARFTILAFTGRPLAALRMLDSRATAPQGFPAESIALWRQTLPALDNPSNDMVTAAIKANVEAARSNLDLTNQAVMVLSTFGAIDQAFDLTDALFAVSSGPAPSATERVPSSVAWRFAPWLFIPPTAPMRADPRFGTLCDTIGLSAYWQQRGVTPDYRIA